MQLCGNLYKLYRFKLYEIEEAPKAGHSRPSRGGVLALLAELRPDAIVHTAAQPSRDLVTLLQRPLPADKQVNILAP